jgi:FKBP-type peptidyl-prolyl cis-trans isomerase FkpA
MQRIGTLALAIIFLVSTVGVGIYAIFTSNQNTKDQQLQAEIQKALEGQNQSEDQQTIKVEEGKLKGTNLANFTPVSSVPSLQTVVLSPGNGAVVKDGDTVTVHYTGALASNGVIFESSLDGGNPATFGLDQVIKGWTQGIPGMQVGESRRLIIPAELAYGSSGAGTIPPNSDLVFDVQLIKIGQ